MVRMFFNNAEKIHEFSLRRNRIKTGKFMNFLYEFIYCLLIFFSPLFF